MKNIRFTLFSLLLISTPSLLTATEGNKLVRNILKHKKEATSTVYTYPTNNLSDNIRGKINIPEPTFNTKILTEEHGGNLFIDVDAGMNPLHALIVRIRETLDPNLFRSLKHILKIIPTLHPILDTPDARGQTALSLLLARQISYKVPEEAIVREKNIKIWSTNARVSTGKKPTDTDHRFIIKVLNRLLRHGANPNKEATTADDHSLFLTPLQIAMRDYPNPEAIKMLLEAKADPAGSSLLKKSLIIGDEAQSPQETVAHTWARTVHDSKIITNIYEQLSAAHEPIFKNPIAPVLAYLTQAEAILSGLPNIHAIPGVEQIPGVQNIDPALVRQQLRELAAAPINQVAARLETVTNTLKDIQELIGLFRSNERTEMVEPKNQSFPCYLPDATNWTPIQRAAQAGNLRAMRLLLYRKGISLTLTPLKYGKESILHLLFAGPGMSDALFKEEASALKSDLDACIIKSIELDPTLLVKKNNAGLTAWAILTSRQQMTSEQYNYLKELLYSYKDKFSNNVNIAMIAAQTSLPSLLLKHSQPNVNASEFNVTDKELSAQDNDGNTILHYAAQGEAPLHFLKFLQRERPIVFANLVNTINTAGDTPLLTLLNGSQRRTLQDIKATVKLFLKQGATLTILDHKQKNAFHYAACWPKPVDKNKKSLYQTIFEHAIKNKVDIDSILQQKDCDGNTPLQIDAYYIQKKKALYSSPVPETTPPLSSLLTKYHQSQLKNKLLLAVVIISAMAIGTYKQNTAFRKKVNDLLVNVKTEIKTSYQKLFSPKKEEPPPLFDFNQSEFEE